MLLVRPSDGLRKVGTLGIQILGGPGQPSDSCCPKFRPQPRKRMRQVSNGRQADRQLTDMPRSFVAHRLKSWTGSPWHQPATALPVSSLEGIRLELERERAPITALDSRAPSRPTSQSGRGWRPRMAHFRPHFRPHFRLSTSIESILCPEPMSIPWGGIQQ